MNTSTIQGTNIDQLFADQYKKYNQQPNPDYKSRLANLKKLEKVILKYRMAIQEAIHKDFKKSPTETDFTETLPTVLELRHEYDFWLKGIFLQ